MFIGNTNDSPQTLEELRDDFMVQIIPDPSYTSHLSAHTTLSDGNTHCFGTHFTKGGDVRKDLLLVNTYPDAETGKPIVKSFLHVRKNVECYAGTATAAEHYHVRIYNPSIEHKNFKLDGKLCTLLDGIVTAEKNQVTINTFLACSDSALTITQNQKDSSINFNISTSDSTPATTFNAKKVPEVDKAFDQAIRSLQKHARILKDDPAASASESTPK